MKGTYDKYEGAQTFGQRLPDQLVPDAQHARDAVEEFLLAPHVAEPLGQGRAVMLPAE